MPIEVRELIIKTEVQSGTNASQGMNQTDIQKMRLRLLKECKDLIQSEVKKNNVR